MPVIAPGGAWCGSAASIERLSNDRYRDNRRDHYEAKKRWHFVDLEISDPDMTRACFGRKPLPAGTPASVGDRNACVVDKIAQFAF